MSDLQTTPDVRSVAVYPATDTTQHHVDRILEPLGDTPQAVAANLAAAGIRGERCNEGACPIATWLLRSDLGLHSVTVFGDTATLWFDDDRPVYVRLRRAVEEFVHRFDNGAHDELLAGGAR